MTLDSGKRNATITPMGVESPSGGNLFGVARGSALIPAPASRVELTSRQREILILRAVHGLTVKESAYELGITEQSVKRESSWLLARIGARSIAHAVFLARHEIEEFMAEVGM